MKINIQSNEKEFFRFYLHKLFFINTSVKSKSVNDDMLLLSQKMNFNKDLFFSINFNNKQLRRFVEDEYFEKKFDKFSFLKNFYKEINKPFIEKIYLELDKYVSNLDIILTNIFGKKSSFSEENLNIYLVNIDCDNSKFYLQATNIIDKNLIYMFFVLPEVFFLNSLFNLLY